VEFLSNHPNPDNRVANANKEISLLGGSQQGFKSDSSEFQNIKRCVQSLPAPPWKGHYPKICKVSRAGTTPDSAPVNPRGHRAV
jgi:hypothetical protein